MGRNGFCRHTTSESSDDAETKSSAVIPDIATTGKPGTRSRICLITSRPLVPCRKISTIARSNGAALEFVQSNLGAGGFDDLEMMDAQHDADHRAHIGLVIDHENTGQRVAPGTASSEPTTDGRIGIDVGLNIPRVGKDAVTAVRRLWSD